MVAKAGPQVTEAKVATVELEVAAWLSAEAEEVILWKVAGAGSPSLPCPSLLETEGPLLLLLQALSLLFPAVLNL